MFRVIFAVVICSLSKVTFAQSDTATVPKSLLHLSGTADTYYRYNFNPPAGSLNNYTNFTNSQNTFELGMASLKAEDTIGKVSATINVGFGRRVEEYSYTSDNTLSSAIKELFVSYAISSKVKFTIGKWYKHTGYESVDPFNNRNYSMSYAFSSGPMFYTGLKTNITLSNQLELMAGIANPADLFTTTSSTKTIIGGLTYHTKNNRLLIKINGQGYSGVSETYQPIVQYRLYNNLLQLDVVAQYKVSNKFNVGINYTDIRATDIDVKRNLNSSVLYLNYKVVPATELALRNEFFADRYGAFKIGTNVFASTFSVNFKINRSLIFVPEFRFDHGADRIFQKPDFSGTANTFTALAALIYVF